MRTDKTRITAVRIRELRKENGISQQKFADAVGVTKMTVVFWECGHCAPNPFNRAMIADVFGCSVEWLTGKDKTTEGEKE